jgi:DNA-binding PadR family transcriptional regulator
MENKEIYENLILELRRGVTSLAVLLLLRREQYGYSLQTNLAEIGLPIEQGTLYPLLRRLESQGLLDSSWRVEEGRPRRYYQINQNGHDLVQKMENEWRQLDEMLRLLNTKIESEEK